MVFRLTNIFVRIFLLLSLISNLYATSAVRVNSLSYGTSDYKEGVLLTDLLIDSSYKFIVINTRMEPVFTGSLTQGEIWNALLKAYHLDFSSVKTPDSYSINVINSAKKVVSSSPIFLITKDTRTIFSKLLDNSLIFFKVQRDGSNVDSQYLKRKPAHLTDLKAITYVTPTFSGDKMKSSTLTPKLGAPNVDVSGGWFDAGDYLKFVQTTSYAVNMMLFSYRDYSSSMDSTLATKLLTESRFGLEWLIKMYDRERGYLRYQVGLGSGNAAIVGDHDLWRLPEADDELNVENKLDPKYFIKYRPVFETPVVGRSLSPNLAGRLASAFAVASQIYRSSDPKFSHKCLEIAMEIYDNAKVSPEPSTLVSVEPHEYYPESEWKDDMELGAVQLYLACGCPDYLIRASHWAKQYISGVTSMRNFSSPDGVNHVSEELKRSKYDDEEEEEDEDEYEANSNEEEDENEDDEEDEENNDFGTRKSKDKGDSGNSDSHEVLNLYDVSGLAHYEYVKAVRSNRDPEETTKLEIDVGSVIKSMKTRIDAGLTRSNSDPFRFAEQYDSGFDLVPHAFGYWIETSLYNELVGSTPSSSYVIFEDRQRDWIFGNNAWGASFVVGAGTTYPTCVQHQVANLVGTINSTDPHLFLVGSVTNGPSREENFKKLDDIPTAKPCPPKGDSDHYIQFSGRGTRFSDDVKSWPSVEPAIDYSVTGLYAFARFSSVMNK